MFNHNKFCQISEIFGPDLAPYYFCCFHRYIATECLWISPKKAGTSTDPSGSVLGIKPFFRCIEVQTLDNKLLNKVIWFPSQELFVLHPLLFLVENNR